jgi:hypothetical protein
MAKSTSSKKTSKAKRERTPKPSPIVVLPVTFVPKIKKPRASTSNMFGRDLLSHRVRFPNTANVTAAELVVLLTEAGLHSHDPLNRLTQHGLDAQAIV